jgi:hypothetical protein
MQTNVRTPTEIFNQPQRLLVPLFQRPYVWNEERQWEPLWNDVVRVATRLLEGGHEAQQPHFLGAVVIQQIQNAMGDLQTRIVIDGQQRLTTLQIVLDAVHAVFEMRGHVHAAARLAYLVENAEAFRRNPEDRFKVWPTNRDRDAFNEVMGIKPPIDYDALRHAGSRLVKAHRYFLSQAEAWLNEDSAYTEAQRADALETSISKLMQLVVIDLQVDENAQEIFETLNARGTPLTPVDLIKNFVFQRLSEEGANVEKIYTDYWELYESTFWEEEIVSGRLRRPRAVVFFNHWLFSMLGEDVTSSEVFTVFKRYLLDRPAISTLDLIKRIHRAAKLYEDLTHKGAAGQGDVDRVALFAYRVEAMQTDIVKPLLMAILDPDRPDPVPQEVVEQIVNDLESWLVRRMLVRVTNKNYNRTMADLIKLTHVTPATELATAIHEFLKCQRSDSTYWPDDAMVRSAVLRTPVYKRFSRGRLRMVLESIEDYMRGYGTGKQGLTGVRTPRGMYTIEHLMPQSWEANWAVPADGDAQLRQERIHTLGNLTLVTQALNSRVSNAAWDVKAQELNRHGVVLLNNRLVEYVQSTWSDNAIERRTQSLIDIILAIWQVPNGHVIETLAQDLAGAFDVSLADLMSAGVIKEGDVLVPSYKSLQHRTALLLANGRISIDGKTYDTPSGAGCYVRDGKATNGYSFWLLGSVQGPSLRLLRERYYEVHQSGGAFEDIDISELAETEETGSIRDLQMRFWEGFVEHVKDCGSPFATRSPQRQSWMSIAIGSSGAYIDAIFTSSIGTMVSMRTNETGPEIRVDFYIPNDDSLFRLLADQQAEIEDVYGAPLCFYAAPSVASRRIFDFMKTDIFDESRWPEYYDWLTERIIRMRKVMGKRV